jgi:heptosyltransferase-2/heptosyltransferase-3
MTRTPRQRLRLALLRAYARSKSADHASRLTPDVSRILVIRPDHLGDLLFTTPALRELRRRYPAAHITALVGPWSAPVLVNNPHVDEIVSLPFPGFTRQPKPSPWQPYTLLRRWARQLRGQYDLAFILRFDHWWGAMLAHLAGVPVRVGYDFPEVKLFLSRALPYTAGRHQVERNLRLVDWEWVDWEDQFPNLPVSQPTEYHIPEQAGVWARNLLQNRPAIAIHPGAGAAIKLWRAQGWAKVGDALAQETGYQVILTGADAERPLCQAIAEKMSTPAWVVAGETTLDQLAAMFARCRLALGPDSGPMHLAVAVGAPTVHLYGPIDPTGFGPWGPPERHRVLISAWPCIPCNRLDYMDTEIPSHPCVREITVEDVLAAAREVLATA